MTDTKSRSLLWRIGNDFYLFKSEESEGYGVIQIRCRECNILYASDESLKWRVLMENGIPSLSPSIKIPPHKDCKGWEGSLLHGKLQTKS